MSSHITELLVDAHRAELVDHARRASLVRAARGGERRANRVRISTARLLLAVAHRLDDQLGLTSTQYIDVP